MEQSRPMTHQEKFKKYWDILTEEETKMSMKRDYKDREKVLFA